MTAARPGILAIFAHPDDEQLVSGTLRQYVERGLRTGIVCATRGEAGEISDPALATPETLGAVREQEMRDAAAIIGVEELYFLGYRDSGMRGTPPNEHAQALINASPDEATRQLARILRAFRPMVVVTFGQEGAYGHPDHLAVHRFATAAFEASGEAARFPEEGLPYAPRRLFYCDMPRQAFALMIEGLRTHGVESPFAALDPHTLGMAEEQITCAMDVSEYVSLKGESLARHRTQTTPETTFWMLPAELWISIRSKETFHLAAGEPMPPGDEGCDLFAGLI